MPDSFTLSYEVKTPASILAEVTLKTSRQAKDQKWSDTSVNEERFRELV